VQQYLQWIHINTIKIKQDVGKVKCMLWVCVKWENEYCDMGKNPKVVGKIINSVLIESL